MTTSLMPEGRQRYYTNDGSPAAGCKLWTYAAGTNALKTTYQDEAGTTPHPNPITLDAKGEALVYWNGAYKVDLKAPDGTQITGYPVDNFKTDPSGAWGLLSTLAASTGAALIGFLQSGVGSIARLVRDKLRDQLNGADFGMVADFNGAGGTDNTAAFNKALAELKSRGGGTLKINPGDYFFGNHAASDIVVTVDQLKNARVEAYGARFILNSAAECTPFLLTFSNPNEVVLAGARFLDTGFNTSAWLTHSRWGMAAVNLQATQACSGFKMVDCVAENLTYLCVADLSAAASRRLLKNIKVIDCEVTNAYYGVDMLYVGDNLEVRNLICKDVRRGYIAYGARNADIDIKLYTSQGFQGSNAFISIACEGATVADSNVENLRLRLNVSGYEAHSAFVHFYHQQPNNTGWIANVDAKIMVNNLSSAGKVAGIGNTSLYQINHELPDTSILSVTSRSMKNIALDAEMVGTITGVPLTVDSINPADPYTISLSPMLTALCQTYTLNNLTNPAYINFLTPFERRTTGAIPYGNTSSGVVTGLVSMIDWCQIGKRVWFNLYMSWTNHTGTGQLRLGDLPLPLDVSFNTLTNLSVVGSGLTHTAGATLVALIGGAANKQVLLYEESGGVLSYVNVDPSVDGLWVSGSYVTP